jgi:hypothetical protein
MMTALVQLGYTGVRDTPTQNRRWPRNSSERASTSRPSGEWDEDDFDVLAEADRFSQQGSAGISLAAQCRRP